MARTNFEKLRVYRLAEKLADLIWEIVLGWNYFARETVGKQLVEAADSVGSNISEGTGRGSFPDNRRFVKIARGSLNETRHWLRRAYRRRLLSQQEIDLIKPIIDELSPSLNAYLHSIGNESRRVTSRKIEATDHGQRTTDK